MIRVLIHACCPTTKRAIASSLAELSANQREFAVALRSLPGGRARTYENNNGHASNFWFGASQTLKASIANNLLDDGIIQSAELFFVAYLESDGSQVRKNTPGWPADNTFESFLAYIGCERIETGYIPT
jgi:hypothetical protein